MRHSVVLLGAFVLFLFVGTALRAKEEPVPVDKIPKAVMDALLAKFPKAKIDKCTKAKEGKDIVYDIEFKQEGRKCEADIKEDGTFINYEKAIEVKDLPKAVREAKLAPVGGGVYRGNGQVMIPGRWDATVTVVRGGHRLGTRQLPVVAR